MESLHELYRIGPGPSASHTMGPRKAAEILRARFPDAAGYSATLYGSLAATGKGHLTDTAIEQALAPKAVAFDWQPSSTLPGHPNGMVLRALDADGKALGEWRGHSVGGGALREEGSADSHKQVYPIRSMASLLKWCEKNSAPMYAYVEECEGPGMWTYLAECWRVMQEAVKRGIASAGVLPGILELKRKAKHHFEQAQLRPGSLKQTGLLTAYALAVSEENAAGGVIVTAPTCGACGVLPGTLYYLRESLNCGEQDILRALATAGLVGNLVKTNASISGAAVGCQGEVGTACAMAAAAAAQLMGGTVKQIEYAAEMGFEHHLGLTCDPIAGLVQIPCIERNAVGAARAVSCAEYSMLGDGEHKVPFDTVVETMRRTGLDMLERYRETSAGGLAEMFAQELGGAKPNQCS